MADGHKGLKFILIRTSQDSGLLGGDRRSQVALTAYPLLMEAYRLNWEEATVANMSLGGRESAYARIIVSVCTCAPFNVCECRHISFLAVVRDSHPDQ